MDQKKECGKCMYYQSILYSYPSKGDCTCLGQEVYFEEDVCEEYEIDNDWEYSGK